MKLTRERAIEECRKMWNWIADKTEERKRIVRKEEYFEENEIKRVPINRCYLCEYSFSNNGISNCDSCPLKFTKRKYIEYNECEEYDSPYWKWMSSYKYKLNAKYARKIANLPEK